MAALFPAERQSDAACAYLAAFREPWPTSILTYLAWAEHFLAPLLNAVQPGRQRLVAHRRQPLPALALIVHKHTASSQQAPAGQPHASVAQAASSSRIKASEGMGTASTPASSISCGVMGPGRMRVPSQALQRSQAPRKHVGRCALSAVVAAPCAYAYTRVMGGQGNIN